MRRKSEVPRLLQSLRPPAPVLIVGGDGTLNSLIPHVGYLPGPVVPVPVGSGNGIAHQLGIHRWEDAVSAVRHARRFEWPIIEVDDRPAALNIAGIGLTGWIAHRFDRSARGLRHYARLLIQGLGIAESAFHLAFPLDRSLTAWDLSFAVGGEWGNGFRIHPTLHPSDPAAAMVIIRKPPLWALPLEVRRLYRRRHERSRHWEAHPARRIVLTEGPPFGHLDGEPWKVTYPVEIRKSRRSLPFYSPAGDHPT